MSSAERSACSSDYENTDLGRCSTAGPRIQHSGLPCCRSITLPGQARARSTATMRQPGSDVEELSALRIESVLKDSMNGPPPPHPAMPYNPIAVPWFRIELEALPLS